jgi:hypothetical protein
MKLTWSEALPTIGLGVLTVLVVIESKKFWSPSVDSPVHPVSSARPQRLDRDTEERLERIEKSIEDLRADIANLHKPVAAPSPEPQRKPEPVHTTVEPDNPRDPLNRGLDYVSRGSYDESKHAQVLIDLAAAYAIPGLAPEMNNALRTTMQQVNDIGTEHIIAAARSLPRQKAVEQLKVFLAMTPKLTPNQKARINAVVTAYQ